ncbi:MAG: hypothetical protein AYK18_02765 [Theionarchaea archaeon DG-70]|nr:MAG: hypothetical protein AYK18_02765 [Theionarchaea archaeon DG-70]
MVETKFGEITAENVGEYLFGLGKSLVGTGIAATIDFFENFPSLDHPYSVIRVGSGLHQGYCIATRNKTEALSSLTFFLTSSAMEYAEGGGSPFDMVIKLIEYGIGTACGYLATKLFDRD